MKTANLLLAVGILLASPLAGRATTLYTETFDETTPGYTTPTGWTISGYGLQYPPYLPQSDGVFIGNGNGTNGTALGYVGMTGVEGSEAAFLFSQGYPSTTPNQAGESPGPDQMDLVNSNVGDTFAANTTYTLTFLSGAALDLDNNYNAVDVGPITVTLDGDGAAAATTTIDGVSTGNLAPGSVVFDTGAAGNSAFVGSDIGIDAGWLNTTDLNKEVGFDDFVLTATPDAVVPEPSTYSLIGLGFAALFFLARRKAAKA